MAYQQLRNAVLAGAALALGACGGGGGGGANFIPSPPVTPAPEPPPPPSPPPPATGSVEIFDSPATQQFASYDAGPGELRIRYDESTKTYEVKADEHDWEVLRQGTNTYEFGSVAPYNWMQTTTPDGYRYTALAAWSTADFGTTAFGIPTPAGGVPTTGSATFDGVIDGWSDARIPDQDGWSLTKVGGSIRFDFDFGAGTLSGQIHPEISAPDLKMNFHSYDLGSFAFSNTVFSRGSTSFSGQFDTTSGGDNSFSGRFNGPGGEELMGKWVLPFVWSAPGAGDNQVHSTAGVFIGKR